MNWSNLHNVDHDVCGKVVVATKESEFKFMDQIFENGIANNTEGIEKISFFDIENAKAMGFRIKLLGISNLTADGIYEEVQPCLVPESSAISKLEGGTNMVIIDSDFIGRTYLSGPGAGEGPTASAIVSDILESHLIVSQMARYCQYSVPLPKP